MAEKLKLLPLHTSFNTRKYVSGSVMSELRDYCVNYCKGLNIQFYLWNTAFKLNKKVMKTLAYSDVMDDSGYRVKYFHRWWLDRLVDEFDSMLWCSVFNQLEGNDKIRFRKADKASEELLKEFR